MKYVHFFFLVRQRWPPEPNDPLSIISRMVAYGWNAIQFWQSVGHAGRQVLNLFVGSSQTDDWFKMLIYVHFKFWAHWCVAPQLSLHLVYMWCQQTMCKLGAKFSLQTMHDLQGERFHVNICKLRHAQRDWACMENSKTKFTGGLHTLTWRVNFLKLRQNLLKHEV